MLWLTGASFREGVKVYFVFESKKNMYVKVKED